MPRIPLYEQTTRAAGPLGPGPLDGPAPAQIAARAVSDLAEGAQRIQQADDATDLAAGLARLRESATNRFLAMQAKAAENGSGFVDEFKRGWATDLDAGLAATRTPRAQKAFRAASLDLQTEFLEKAARFESSRAQSYQTTSTEDAITRLGATVQSDPAQFEGALLEQTALINGLAIDPERRVALKRQAAQTLSEAAAIGLASKNPTLAIQRASAPAANDTLFASLSPKARSEVLQQARVALVDQASSSVLARYERGGPDAGVRALASVLPGVPAELQDDVRARVNASVGQLRQQRQQEHAGELTRIAEDIASDTAGTSTRQKVEQLYSVGAFSPEQRASFHAQIDEAAIRAAKAGAGAREIAAALAEGLPLDPKDADQRKALSAAFTYDTAKAAPGSQDWQATAQIYAQRARMLPDPALAWTRQAMRSPDLKLAANAAQFFGAVQAATPDAVGQFDDDTKAFAGTVNAMIEAGTAPARAVETARNIVFDVRPELRKQRQETFRTLHAKSQGGALGSFIDRDFDTSWFSAQPAASAGLSTDFDSQTARYFDKVGDIGLARELAWKDLARVYGPSRVNGDAIVMPLPPERFGLKPEDVRKEIGALPLPSGTTAADILVVPDAITLRNVGDTLNGQTVRPSYALVNGKTGDVLTDEHGLRIRYTVPSGEELGRRFKAAQDAAAAEALAAARIEREKREAAARTLVERAQKRELPRLGGSG